MLDCMSDEREKQLRNLTDFAENVHREIKNLASTLNWTIESIQNDNEKWLVCPYDSSHQITKESLNQHLVSCQWKAEGYRESDIPLSEPGVSSNSLSTIKFDSVMQSNILKNAKEQNPTLKIGSCERLVPRTSDRLLTDFTSDERRAFYEYVISNTVQADIGCDITDTHKPRSLDKEGKELSFLELLVQERNLKRRRAKHRGVHTNKKSHTEIIREVINQQMELYSDYMTETHSNSWIGENTENARTQTLNIESNETMQNTSRSMKEASSKHSSILSNDAHRYRSSGRYRDEYERSAEKHSTRSRDRDKRDKYSPSRDSIKKHKRHEHRKRSRSREHKSKKDKYRSKCLSYERDSHKSYKADKTLEQSYSRRHDDRRKNRNKSLI